MAQGGWAWHKGAGRTQTVCASTSLPVRVGGTKVRWRGRGEVVGFVHQVHKKLYAVSVACEGT